MPEPVHIAIIIPAAGASKRYGSAKQLLKWGNSNLITHCIATANSLTCDEIILVLGAHFERIRQQIPDLPMEILKNNRWETGMGSSIALGVKKITEDMPKINAVLILLPDQPLVDTEMLNSIVDSFSPGSEQIIASGYADGRVGVPALFDRSFFELLCELDDDKGARHIIRENRSKLVVIPGDDKLVDIDTPETYDALYKANHL